MESIDFITGSRQPSQDDDLEAESERYRKRARIISGSIHVSGSILHNHANSNANSNASSNSNSNSNSNGDHNWNNIDPIVVVEPSNSTIVTHAEDREIDDDFMHNLTTVSEFDRSLRMLATAIFFQPHPLPLMTERHDVAEIDEIDGVAVNVSVYSKSSVYICSLRIVITLRVDLISGINVLDPVILFRRAFAIGHWSPMKIHAALNELYTSLSHLHFDRKLGEFVDASFSGSHDSVFQESCANIFSRGSVWAALSSSSNILRRMSNKITCVVCYNETGTVVPCGNSHVLCYPCLSKMAVSRGNDFMRQKCDRFVSCPCCRIRIADSIITDEFFLNNRTLAEEIAEEIAVLQGSSDDDETIYDF